MEHHRTAKDFVELLDLNGQTSHSISLDGLLMQIFDFVHAIWLSPQLESFVDHGIDHSYKVIEKALNIYDSISHSQIKLSPLERLTIGIAGLVHDIGMQYNKYPKNNKIFDDFEVRNNHCKLGDEMISDLIDGKLSERSCPTFSLQEQQQYFLVQGARLGFSHSGTLFWNKLTDKTYDERKDGSFNFRPRMIASLIRLGDELHCEYSRVPELNLITSSKLTSEAKAHWVASYYIDEVKIISPGTAGARIYLKWRVSENADEEEIEVIRALLLDLRSKKANQEAAIVKKHFKIDERSEPFFVEVELDSEPARVPIIQHIPPEVVDYVKTTVRPYQFGIKKQQKTDRIHEINSQKADRPKSRMQDFLLAGKATVTGHFRLKTGWHTNRYIKCRELCSETEFIKDLCGVLVEKYALFNFTDLIAIGTSATRIGSLLAFMLGVKFSYTFEKLKVIDPLQHNNYTPYETDIELSGGNRILIVDDILGVGSVISKLYQEICNNYCQPEIVRCFALIKLGDVNTLIDDIANIEVDYLVSYPDVEYHEENITGVCDVCKDNPSMIKDEM